jgi:thiol-disulfide isomerase/thioredoxin
MAFVVSIAEKQWENTGRCHAPNREHQYTMKLPISRFLSSFLCALSTGAVLSMPLAVAAESVDFTLPDLDNKPLKLSDFRGKWVVVNYWATWCPPCLSEIPELIDFHEEHKDSDAVVLGVDFEDIPLKELNEFTEEYFMNYPNVRMKPGPRGHLGIIEGLPTTFLVSPQGEVLAKQTGPVTRQLIEEFINGHKADETKEPVTPVVSTVSKVQQKVQ